ncbi:hypothetical protein MFU01_71600 [Myxococcus fulvus]|uniref:Uncharacterized protein n=1 Tax=Myxococcus fulvus TaxID=33 RepID=A0A511TEQ3_MYXFU|nr:hypothetical protein MFU01_71600 [Myxococcus fulvus]
MTHLDDTQPVDLHLVVDDTVTPNELHRTGHLFLVRSPVPPSCLHITVRHGEYAVCANLTPRYPGRRRSLRTLNRRSGAVDHDTYHGLRELHSGSGRQSARANRNTWPLRLPSRVPGRSPPDFSGTLAEGDVG